MEYQYYKMNYQDKYNASSHVTSLRKPNASILEKDNHKLNYTQHGQIMTDKFCKFMKEF